MLKRDKTSSETNKKNKEVRWRLNAPVEKLEDFEDELAAKSQVCRQIMHQSGDFNIKYDKWRNVVERVALETIGKSTVKFGSRRNESGIVRSIRREKKNAKKEFEDETCAVKKPKLKKIYMRKQGELRTQIEYEHNDAISKKFSSMVSGRK